ncbi:MAG: GAF domain-containing protein [Candidatus Omnitrophica bacterium]|nr:GAF domain-containing protein [Candidatus Omnitrophota bacterium]
MIYFIYSGIINAITSFILALFVLSKNSKSPINRGFFYFAFSVGFWAFNYSFWLLSKDPTQALFLVRCAMIGAILIPVTFIYFVTKLLKQERKILNVINFTIAGIFLSFSFSSIYIEKVEPRLFFPFWPVPSYLFHLMLLHFILNVIYAHASLWNEIKKSYGTGKIQIKYVFFGTLIGFIGGCTNYFLWYKIPIPPYLNILVGAYVFCVAYAIVRHQFMDIEVIIKKTLVFASLFAVVLGIFVGITVLTQEILAGGRLLGLAISSIIIILIVRPLENFLISITDKFLFQKKYDYKQVLKSFIDEVITVLDLDIIIKKTLELLSKMFHPERAAILLLNNDEDRYVSHGYLGYDKNIVLDRNASIPTYLKAKKNIISGEDRNLNETLKNEMDSINTSLIIPLMIHDDLIGIMLLGKKKSDVPYSKEDLDILTDLAQTEATVVSNSRTHTLLLQAKEKEQQTEHLVSLAFVVTNISHELRNPIQIMLGAAETTLDAIDRELDINALDEKGKNTISYVKSKLKTIMEKSDKTNEMLNSILHSLKITPQNFTFLSIKEIAAEAINRVESYLEPADIKATNSVPDGFSRIKGDRITLEQVFVNLLTNAIQAIEFAKKGDKINITAFDLDDKIRIEISDNGPGIPEQDVRRIFEPFYTTKDNLYTYKSGKSKGAGLGLMIVHQTIARHEGAIYVRSKAGEGTTFVIDLPKRV